MLDPNIILRGQQVENPFESAAQGIQFGQGLRQLLSGRQAGKMQQITSPEERQAFANKSMFSRELNAQIKADALAQEQKALALQKHNADIGKTKSEAFKNNQQGGGYGLDNAGKLMASANQALTVAAQTGDPMAARLALNNSLKAGAITPELYAQFDEQIKLIGNDPEALKKYAQSIVLAQSKDPDKYMFTTADNVLDNETSIQNNTLTNQTSADNNIRTNQTAENNNIRTTDTSRYSTDVGAQTAANKLSVEQAKIELEQKKGTVQQFGDGLYMVYPNGSAVPISSPTGQKIAPGKPESKIEKIERVEKTQNFATASRSAADGATLAASLASDLDGMNAAAGGFGLQARVPGSQAHSFASKLETLKSGVFLAQISNMKGMGALTDAEGARLEKSIAALDLSLNPQDLQANLTQIAQTLSRAAKAANSKTHLYAGQDQPARPKQEIPATLANPFGDGKPNAMDFFK